MAVGVGSTTTQAATDSSSTSFSHTTAAGSGRMLLVVVSGMKYQVGSVPWEPSSITYGGVSLSEALTFQSYTTNRNYTVSAYYLASPAEGAGTVAVTLSTTANKWYAFAISLTGAKSTGVPVSTATDSTFTSDRAEADLTPTTVGNLLIAAASLRGDGGSGWTPDAGITELVDVATGTGNTDLSASVWYVVADSTSATSVDSTAPYSLGGALWLEIPVFANVLVSSEIASASSGASIGSVEKGSVSVSPSAASAASSAVIGSITSETIVSPGNAVAVSAATLGSAGAPISLSPGNAVATSAATIVRVSTRTSVPTEVTLPYRGAGLTLFRRDDTVLTLPVRDIELTVSR